MHDITVTRGSAGHVVSSGRGIDLALDHHRYGPHSNLFTDIDVGAGSRMQSLDIGLRSMRRATDAIIELETVDLLRDELGLARA